MQDNNYDGTDFENPDRFATRRQAVNHVGFTAINPTWFMAVN
ncbi:MAG: hypothetical protein ACYSWW_26100 [Planctomycetota bacterium]